MARAPTARQAPGRRILSAQPVLPGHLQAALSQCCHPHSVREDAEAQGSTQLFRAPQGIADVCWDLGPPGRRSPPCYRGQGVQGSRPCVGDLNES